MMKKFIPLLIVAAGAAAYVLSKKTKKEEDDEIKIITLENTDGENDADDAENEEAEEDLNTEETDPDEKADEDPEEDAIACIQIRYPYLKKSFIEETLDYTENFSEEYPQGSMVRINHVAKFERVEDLISFVRMAKENDYQVQEAEEENTILAICDCLVQGDSILTDVFKVANQVFNLNGEYFGFRVDKL